MTKSEVQDIISEELKRALGRHAGQFDLRETASQRQVREAAEERQLKEAKRIRKEEKRHTKQMREVHRGIFQTDGMSSKDAKKAAKLLESDAYQARYRGL
jgi:pimeloyl-CoA synthetase